MLLRASWPELTAVNSNSTASSDPECIPAALTQELGMRGTVKGVEVLRTDVQSVQLHIDSPEQCNPDRAAWQLGSLPVHACCALLSPHLQPQTAQAACTR